MIMSQVSVPVRTGNRVERSIKIIYYFGWLCEAGRPVGLSTFLMTISATDYKMLDKRSHGPVVFPNPQLSFVWGIIGGSQNHLIFVNITTKI